jgi:hypothetical protein
LRIGINQQNFVAATGKASSKVDGDRGFAATAFLVCHRKDIRHLKTEDSTSAPQRKDAQLYVFTVLHFFSLRIYDQTHKRRQIGGACHGLHRKSASQAMGFIVNFSP